MFSLIFEKIIFVPYFSSRLPIIIIQKTKAVQESDNPLQMRNRSYASLSEVWRFIKDLGISKVELSLKDIETLMETLVFDGKAESKLSMMRDQDDEEEEEEITKLYRVCSDNLGIIGNGMMRMPCGGCPVIRDCNVGGVISPATCAYLKQWLDF